VRELDAVSKIQKILDSISPREKNKTGDIYLNIIQNEFIKIDGRIDIPKISVNELDYRSSAGIVEKMSPFIPEFLFKSKLLERRIPPSDQHFFQFIKSVRGRALEFTHMFKIDIKFGGDSSTIIEKGGTEFYPSYFTDRIYFKSRLIPGTVTQHPGRSELNTLRLMDANRVDSEGFFYSFAVFEDIKARETSKKLSDFLGSDMFKISTDIYPFVVYDYFTGCLNIPCPSYDQIEEAVSVFEPAFLYIYSFYKNVDGILGPGSIGEIFSDELEYTDQGLVLTPSYRERLRKYFSRYALYQDDDLALKGWRRFIIDEA
jgi:hypothetical protein